jgi:predicted Zn-dependent protease
MFKIFVFIAVFFAGPAGFAAERGTDAVMNALTKELNRSFKELKNAEKAPLYFLGYEIIEASTSYLNSKMGATNGDSDYVSRKLDINVRVNTPEMDNTHQIKGESPWASYSQTQNLPVSLDENEDALRARIWEYTDKAYKKAQENFTKVAMNKAVTAQEEDPSPDFAAAKPERFYETATLRPMDKELWRGKLNRFSAKFAAYPFIYDSEVSLSAKTENRYIVNSEGSRIKTGNNYLTLSFSLASRTTDGMELLRGERYNGASYSELPSDEKVLADIEKSITELKALRDAPIVEPYHGPAILKARAAAVYFHEIIGHRLEGHRQKIEDEGQTFSKKVGQKITSDILTVYDDPNIKEFLGRSLRGHYKYDDEGVKAGRASLIDAGVLKGFLMNRSPIRNFPSSNGHGRHSSGRPTVSRMANTIVEASRTVPYAELRKQLIDECKKQNKPFGLVFDDISGGFTNTGRSGPQSFKVLPLLVYRVYANGRPDEVVRGVDIVGTPIASLSKVSAAADDPDIFNGTCGAESGWVPVSAVSPSLLLTEIEVEKSEKSQEKPPVLEPPLHDK